MKPTFVDINLVRGWWESCNPQTWMWMLEQVGSSWTPSDPLPIVAINRAFFRFAIGQS